MNEEEKSKLDKLNEGLYSPNAPVVNKIFRRGIDNPSSPSGQAPNQAWKPVEKPSSIKKVFSWADKDQPIFRKLLWWALGFFIICFGLAAYLYLHGVNTVSPNKIDIAFSAPLSVSASNPFSMDITVTNRNNSDLNSVDLLVDYPDGSRSIEDPNRPMIEDLIHAGTISKGQLVKKRSEAILFGQEGEKKNITVTLHYKVTGSTSVFEKKTNYEVTISSAPVTVSVDSVKELNSNQELTFDIKVTSNSANVLKNVGVQPTFPFGFTLSAEEPEFFGTSSINPQPLWVINELAPAESKEFTIHGILKGVKDEDKYFKFQVGSVDPNNPQRILTQYVSVDRLIAIKLPFISSDISIGNNKNTGIVNVGETVPGSIAFENNLDTDITDLELVLKINDNNLIDKSHINVSNGFYNSVNNTITWNKQTRNDFQTVHPGQGSSVNFTLPFINPTPQVLNSGSLKNLSVGFDLTIRAKRLSDINVPELITLLDSSSVKVATVAQITPTITYTTGAFANTGGIPPHVNNPTSYTINWKISDTLNDLQNAVVTAELPPYVTFGDLFAPLSQDVTFDKNSNIVTWNVGNVYAGQGYKTAPREVSFRVILTPSANQAGTVPNVMTGIHLEAVDAFTGAKVTNDAPNLTTELRTDPGFKFGNDKVGP